MKVLLPHTFKKTGAIIAPIGFFLWLLMQFGIIKNILVSCFGAPITAAMISIYHIINALVALVGFLSFLAGMYFLCFSKEKVEDEMIDKIRLESFQFAAVIQIFFTIGGFLFMILFGSPNEGLLMLFFISALFLFWLSYIARFNITLPKRTHGE